jgi:hypothetical protein
MKHDMIHITKEREGAAMKNISVIKTITLAMIVLAAPVFIGGCKTMEATKQTASNIQKSLASDASEKDASGGKPAAAAATKAAKPVTYENHVTEEYLKQYQGISHAFSIDGGRMLTKCWRTVNNVITDDYILWDFDRNLNTYVKNRGLSFGELDLAAYLSPDGRYVAILRALEKFDPAKGVDLSRHRTDIVRIGDGKRVRHFPMWMHSISFSSDSAMIAGTVIRPADRITGAKQSDNFEIYAVESGKRVNTAQKVEASYTPAIFDPQNRYLAVTGADATRILETRNFSVVEQWPKTSLAAVSPDGNHIALRESESTIRTFKVGSYVGRWTEIGTIECFAKTVSIGPQNTLVDEHAEFDLEGTEIRWFSSGWYPIRVYVKEADTWFGFNKHNVSREQSLSERSLQAANLVSEGKRLLKAGFSDLGVNKIKEGIARDPGLAEFLGWLSGGTVKPGLNLAWQGDLLACYNRSNPSFSGYYVYGLLASTAGHPGLVDQAVQRLRQLGQDLQPAGQQYAQEKALILEALNLAAQGSPDRAYRYLAERGIKLDPGDFTNKVLAEHFLFPLFQDRKKLMYILDDVPELLLPRPAMKPIVPQPFPDLTGKLTKPPAR